MSDWIIQAITDFGYAGIFELMLAENVFPPIPSELIMPFAGYVAARGDLNGVGVLLAGLAGTVCGMLPWYLAGRWLTADRLGRLADRRGRWLTLNSVEIVRTSRWFDRHGYWAVFFGRLIPAIRTLISVPAGLAAMPLLPFLLISAAGSLIWIGVLTGSGFILNQHYDAVSSWVDPVTKVVVGAAVALYLFRLVTWRPQR